jgi:hypothetical protein
LAAQDGCHWPFRPRTQSSGWAHKLPIDFAGGYRFLHIGLQFNPPDSSLVWADSVIKRFPGLPTIISTHDYLGPNGQFVEWPVDIKSIDPIDNDAQRVWESFIREHSQIFLVLNGHTCAQGRAVQKNRFGYAVYALLSDYQCRAQVARDAGQKDVDGLGDGWLRLMTFHMDTSTPTIQVRTYSTYYRRYSTELPQYAAWYKAGEAPKLTDAEFNDRDDFILELTDFHERFARTTPGLR